MGATVKPTAYISWIPIGKVTVKPADAYISWLPLGAIELTPQICASWVPMGTISIKPEICASYVPASRVVTIKADTRRRTSLPNDIKTDAERKTTRFNMVATDTKREVFSRFIAWTSVDLLRRIAMPNTIAADTARMLGGIYERVHADTSRRTAVNYCVVSGDTWRFVEKRERVLVDTFRIPGIGNLVKGDTYRMTGSGNPTTADLRRSLIKQECIIADTWIRVPLVLEYVDRSRKWLKAKRFRAAATNASSIMQNFHDHGIKSFSFTLGELTLSDTFSMETVQPLNIDDAVQGQILDHHFSFHVEETSQRDLVQTVKGMYDQDALLYTAINIFVEEANVSYYAQEVARALRLSLDRHSDDFVPSQEFQDSGMTYQDFISSLFGWTSKLPQRQINVFIRGDTLHIIQRGQEQSVVDITNWPHSRPTIERKLVRSIWNSRDNDTIENKAHNDEDTDPVPFSGTISLGEISRTYVNGYLTRETNEDGETTYSYDGEYLSEKRTHNKDGFTSLTEYSYAETNRDIYLFKERERQTEPIDDGREHNIYDWTDWNNENGTERITYHAPLGYGWYATTVYVDGALEGSSLSQGKPGGKASRFTIDQSNLSLGAHYSVYEDEEGPVTIPFTSLIDTEFPVKGDDYLLELTKAIEWLNRKTQETVTVEVVANVKNGVPDVNHVVDFTERIRFEGQEYFLCSNSVQLTPRSLRQTIKMTRWY